MAKSECSKPRSVPLALSTISVDVAVIVVDRMYWKMLNMKAKPRYTKIPIFGYDSDPIACKQLKSVMHKIQVSMTVKGPPINLTMGPRRNPTEIPFTMDIAENTSPNSSSFIL